jgi:quercetin dioxygenase-like cupin family protein
VGDVMGVPTGLEDLLERRLPSAIPRTDDALAASGSADAEIGRSKDAIAAVGIAAASPAAPPGTLRERLLASRGRPGRYGIFADRLARLFDLPLADAEALTKRLEQPDAWAPFLIEGIEMIPVTAGPKLSGAIATLVRLQPGTKFPEHAHHGDETMLVLDGGFKESTDDGEEVWRADELVRHDGSSHAFVALPGVPCIAAALITGHADFL